MLLLPQLTIAENVVHSSRISPQARSKVLQKAVFLAAASLAYLSSFSLHSAVNEVGLKSQTVIDLLQQCRSERKRATDRDEQKYLWKKGTVLQSPLPARK